MWECGERKIDARRRNELCEMGRERRELSTQTSLEPQLQISTELVF